MKIAKFIATYILVALLSITVLAEVGIHIFLRTTLNEDYVIGLLEKEGFYDFAYETIKTHLNGYIDNTSIEDNILENVYTKEDIKNDINILFGNLYKKEVKKIDTSDISKRLEENIENLKQSKELTIAQERVLEDLEEKVVRGYTSQIYQFDYFSQINGIFFRINELIKQFNIGIYILIGVFAFLIILINLDSILNALLAFSVGSVICGAVQKEIYKINVSDYITSKLYDTNARIIRTINNIFTEIENNLHDIGMRLLVIGAIAFSITILIKVILFIVKILKKHKIREEIMENDNNDEKIEIDIQNKENLEIEKIEDKRS